MGDRESIFESSELWLSSHKNEKYFTSNKYYVAALSDPTGEYILRFEAVYSGIRRVLNFWKQTNTVAFNCNMKDITKIESKLGEVIVHYKESKFWINYKGEADFEYK